MNILKTEMMLGEREQNLDKKKKTTKMFHCTGDAEGRIESMCIMKQDFKVSRTSQSVRVLDSKGVGYMYGGSIMKFSEINEQRLLKNHIRSQIEKNGINLNYDLCPTNVKYFDVTDDIFLNKWNDTDKCVAFDIDMAYYKTAYTLGFIDKEYFEKCEKLPKMVRLRLIGSIATKKRTYTYTSGKLSSIEIKQDKDLRAVWFAIVKSVGDCMDEFKALSNLHGRNRFIMYWVDGIYLKGQSEDYFDILREIQEKYNLTFKTEFVNKIEYHFDNQYKYGKLRVFKRDLEGRVDRKTGEIKDYKEFSLEKKHDIYNMINYFKDE